MAIICAQSLVICNRIIKTNNTKKWVKIVLRDTKWVCSKLKTSWLRSSKCSKWRSKMGLGQFRHKEKGESSCKIISRIPEALKETTRVALLIWWFPKMKWFLNLINKDKVLVCRHLHSSSSNKLILNNKHSQLITLKELWSECKAIKMANYNSNITTVLFRLLLKTLQRRTTTKVQNILCKMLLKRKLKNSPLKMLQLKKEWIPVQNSEVTPISFWDQLVLIIK